MFKMKATAKLLDINEKTLPGTPQIHCVFDLESSFSSCALCDLSLSLKISSPPHSGRGRHVGSQPQRECPRQV